MSFSRFCRFTLVFTAAVFAVVAAAPAAAYYPSTDSTIEKVETMLNEINHGTHDKKLQKPDKAYEQLRKAHEQCCQYKKALDRLNGNSVKKQQEKKEKEKWGSHYYSSSKSTKSDTASRYELSCRKFEEASKAFYAEIGPLMETLQVSENTWKYTWGIKNFCKYGTKDTGDKYLFKVEKKTFKEALIDCLEGHLEQLQNRKDKSDYL